MLTNADKEKIIAIAKPTRMTFIEVHNRVPDLPDGDAWDYTQIPWDADCNAIQEALEGGGSNAQERWDFYKACLMQSESDYWKQRAGEAGEAVTLDECRIESAAAAGG